MVLKRDVKSRLTCSVIFVVVVLSNLMTGCNGKTEISGPLTPEQQQIKTVISNRQAGLKDMGAAFKAIKDELKANNAKSTTVKFSANAVRSYARDAKHWFPTGSGPDSGFETDAKKNIWENPEDFNQLMLSLEKESAELSVIAGSGDAEAIAMQAKRTSAVCKKCHDKYREEE